MNIDLTLMEIEEIIDCMKCVDPIYADSNMFYKYLLMKLVSHRDKMEKEKPICINLDGIDPPAMIPEVKFIEITNEEYKKLFKEFNTSDTSISSSLNE
jgi:hypothetical protein